ncbi:urea amidolyase associated protein UAAP1 [Nitrosomonas sp.]|uniref:urea amidolyase associated protein UAAP1 n=1 Tax=Nitrosomonas sp. TaxID=42353 RepID=UPI00284512CE|nr:urea amidolyase associated protein UAAP1 [Nitrosomonas sp.]MCP5243047.1 urea carboxylase-associated family protein [Burkholderiales bacterium]MDR4514955.1 urea carboxylase-associated family protein [Nitrosomonas sp.]
MNQNQQFFWQETVPGGCHWSGIVRRGTTLRLTDMNGRANAAMLFYNQEEKLERYNMADTLKSQHTFYLTEGHACHSDMGRIFCRITQDTVGWHDTVCGISDAEQVRAQYGVARYQEKRNDMYRNGLDNMLIELGKWGLGRCDIVSNLNFFSKVNANASGELTFHPGNSKAGDFVDLSFEMNTLVVLSATPHPLNRSETYQPGTVELSLYETPSDRAAKCLQIAENRRGMENTQRYYVSGGKL